jgi:hypothetical protein
MTANSFRILPGAVFALALLSPAGASAKGIVFITWGDTITHVGNATNPAKLPTTQVGYKYGHFGIFWIDLCTYSGTFCVYEGNRYNPITRAEAAQLLGMNETDLATPFLYRVPLGWMILGPVIAIWIVVALVRKDRRVDVAALFRDARYQQALAILNDEYAARTTPEPTGPDGQTPSGTGDADPFHAAFQAGVEHLVNEGVARPEAERNLGLMVQVLSQSAQQEPSDKGTSHEPGDRSAAVDNGPTTEAAPPNRLPADHGSLPKYPG